MPSAILQIIVQASGLLNPIAAVMTVLHWLHCIIAVHYCSALLQCIILKKSLVNASRILATIYLRSD